jgi:plasmid stabilization system protein ParE
LKNIFDYLELKFSEKDIKKFAKKLDKQLEILKRTPETFMFSNDSKQVRRTIVAKLTSIYYRIEENEVKIISIFDNRQNPEKLKI